MTTHFSIGQSVWMKTGSPEMVVHKIEVSKGEGFQNGIIERYQVTWKSPSGVHHSEFFSWDSLTDIQPEIEEAG